MELRTSLTIGAICAFIGAPLGIAVNGLHPPLPRDGEVALRIIAQTSGWPLIHLGIIAALLLLAGSLLAISRSIDRGRSRAIAEFGLLAAVVGITIMAADIAIDGYATRPLARAWLDATPAEQRVAFHVALGVLSAQEALFFLGFAIVFGLTFVLYGAAVSGSGIYPRCLGTIAVIAGAGSLVLGVGFFLRAGWATAIFLHGLALILTLWVLTMGSLLWRRAGALRESAMQWRASAIGEDPRGT
jgi:hypothetical protein